MRELVTRRQLKVARSQGPLKPVRDRAGPIGRLLFHVGSRPNFCQLVGTAPSGPQWLREIKLDGFRMSARIERGRVQLLTRTGLDWSDKYPSVVEALAKVGAKTAYLDGELCGIGEMACQAFRRPQAASDGSRGVRLVYFAFVLLHLDRCDIVSLPLIERKAMLEPLVVKI